MGADGTIRQVRREDLSEFVTSLGSQFSSAPIAPARLRAFLERTLIDSPWADPEIPSLVYVEEGKILGTIAASSRRMLFDGAPTRVACSAFLWADPSVRARGIGAQLLRALLTGPQDLTITDAASEPVRRMWEAMGGRTLHVSRFSFNRIFRPWELAHRRFADRPRSPAGRIAAPVASALDRISMAVGRTKLIPDPPLGTVEPLSPDAMVEHLPAVTQSFRLAPAYDRRYLEWLFRELEHIDEQSLPWLHARPRGEFAAELVRRNGRVAGWFICHSRPGGLCRVLQVAATPRTADAVLNQLSCWAWEAGAAALVGRIDPHIVAPLAAIPSVVRYSSSGWVLVHARDPELLGAILAGHAFLTRLDAEWWIS